MQAQLRASVQQARRAQALALPAGTDPHGWAVGNWRVTVLRVAVALVFAAGLATSLILGLQAADGGATPRGGIIIDGDAVDLEKRVEFPTDLQIARPGDVLTYTLVITNNEPSTLPSIVVTDSPSVYVTYVPSSTELDSGTGFIPIADNEIGETVESAFPLATGYVGTDLAAGQAIRLRYRVLVTDVLPIGVTQIENRAEVLALSDVVVAVLQVPALGNPALAVEKRVNWATSDSAPGLLVRSGDLLSWTYWITNTGALTLANLALVDSDPLVTPTLTVTDAGDVLAPGAGLVYSATGLAVAGPYSNTATVNAESLGLTETVTAVAVSHYFGIAPALDFSLTATPTQILADEQVTYTYSLTNAGNVTLTNLTVSDAFCSPLESLNGDNGNVDNDNSGNDAGENGNGEVESGATDIAELGVGETIQLDCTRALTATTTSTATAGGIDPLGEPITATANATVTVISEPVARAELTLIKTPSAMTVTAGTLVTYTYDVTNTGDLTVTALALGDDRCGPVEALPSAEDALATGLIPGAGVAFGCSAVITEPTFNTAVVSGLDPLSNTVTATATAFVDVVGPAMEFTKSPSVPYVARGGTVTYTLAVTNSGSLPWVALAVEDDLCSELQALDETEGPIDEGETRRFVCASVLEIDTRNVATATATLESGATFRRVATAFVQVPFYYVPWVTKSPLPPVACLPPEGCIVPDIDDVKALAYHRAAGRLYVLSQASQTVVMLDPVTFEVYARVDTDVQPWAMVLDEEANRLYVSQSTGGGEGSIGVYEATTLTKLTQIPVVGVPGQMARLSALDTLFVLTRPDSRVVVIEGESVVQDVDAGGSGPYGIAADPGNARVYVTHRDSGSLSLLQQSGAGWEALPGPRFLGERQYFSAAWQPSGEKLYVLTADAASNWSVEVWKPSVTPPWSRLTAPTIPSGGALDDPGVGGAGIVINSTMGHIFTANTADDSLSRLEGVNDTVIQRIELDPDGGVRPFVLAVDPDASIVFVGFAGDGRIMKVWD